MLQICAQSPSKHQPQDGDGRGQFAITPSLTHTHTNFYLCARCTTTHHKTMPDSHHSAGGPWPHTTQKAHMEKPSTLRRLNRQTSNWLLTQDLTQIHSGGRQLTVAPAPYMQNTCKRISRFLMKFNRWTVHVPATRNAHLLRSVADDLGIQVCVHQMGHTITSTWRSLKTHTQLFQTNKSEITALRQSSYTPEWRRPSTSGCTPAV